MTRHSHPGSLPYLTEHPFSSGTRTHCPLKTPDGNLTQWAFHGVQEHPNRNSDEEVMTFRSWRSHMTKQSHPGSLPYLLERPFTAGRNSDEEVMTFRSWRSHMTKQSH